MDPDEVITKDKLGTKNSTAYYEDKHECDSMEVNNLPMRGILKKQLYMHITCVL